MIKTKTARAIAIAIMLGSAYVPIALGATANASSDNFYGYYTKSNTQDIPSNITGQYADIVVNLQGKGTLVFDRNKSYKPVWKAAGNDFTIPHLHPNLIGNNTRFDPSNEFSFARIISQDSNKIVVHWRYFPTPQANLAGKPTAVVHELYTIYSDGTVTRLYRPGEDSIEDWNKQTNALSQTLTLKADGLEVSSTQNASISSASNNVESTPLVNGELRGNAISHWRFDQASGKNVSDSIGSAHGELESHGSDFVPGISGRAIQLDGYRSRMLVNKLSAPTIPQKFSISSWVNLSALPFNTSPILHQSSLNGGFFLGVDDLGHVVFEHNAVKLVSDSPVLLNQWSNIVVSYSDNITLYIDGVKVGDVVNTNVGSIPNDTLVAGLNSEPKAATEGVRYGEIDQYNHFSSIIGIEGLLDELVIFGTPLSSEDVLANYSLYSKVVTPSNRSLPDLEKFPQQFGAQYTKLDFHPIWDNMWRVPEYEDIVVRFDNKPVSLVYWRGTSHGMNLVTEGRWMSDQSVEIIIPDPTDPETNIEPRTVTLAEHMSDKFALRTHVRLVENTPARVKVHWRYAAADVFGTTVIDNAFIDETHTIYPDGVAIRDVYYHPNVSTQGKEFYQDFQWLAGPGEQIEDIIEKQAVSLSDMNGVRRDIVYPFDHPEGQTPAPLPGNIAVLNTKTNWKVFGIGQAGGFWPASNHERSPYFTYEGQPFPFAGPWNHWPVAQIPSDGRFAVDDDRVSHFAVGNLEAFDYGTGSMLYGFTQNSPESMTQLAKSWIQPTACQAISGINGSITYNMDERAFELEAMDAIGDVSLNLIADNESPLVNPTLVVKNWDSSKLPTILIEGNILSSNTIGITRDTSGRQMLVIFIEGVFIDDANVTLKR